MATKADALAMLKGLGNKVKQMALNLTEIELKVEQATNNDPWGPHGTVMGEIAKAAFEVESYKQIMGVVARRLQDSGEDWRHVYKSLLLLEYMAKHGPQKVVEELVSNITVIEKLQNFQYKDKNSKDWGINVRQRAKELTNLVLDSERIRQERNKAKVNSQKFTGVSSDDIRGGGFGAKASFGSSSSGASSFGASAASSRFVADDPPPPDYKSATAKFGEARDPVEATRARIEALKKEGPLPESPRVSSDSIPAVSKPVVFRVQASAPGPAGPKRLSEVKVNPTIAASLGKLAPPASSTAAAARPAASAPAAAAPQAASVPDLLGGLDHPAPAAAPQPAPAAAASSAWDSFDAKPASPGGDVWSTFATDRPSDGAADAFGSDPFGSTAIAPAASKPAPAAADPFAVSHGADPFAAKPAADPFAVAAPSSNGAATAADALKAKPAAPKAALPEDIFSVAPAPPPAPAPGQFGQFMQRPQQPGFPSQQAFPQQLAGGGFMQQQPGYPQPTAGFQQAMPGFGQQPGGFGQPQGGFPAPGGAPGGFGQPAAAGFPGPGAGFGQGGFGAGPTFPQMGMQQGFGSPGGFQAASQAPPNISHLGYASGPTAGLSPTAGGGQSGKKDPFADLSAF
ncbi:hypothetical protein WJX72_001430 [[Myrmecia] bisecta]|uniref:ENTH domain-containing protein n=1 Tax=[Myrmecia] bisecta TaxID=41462 RepID=A0AAW1Q3E3_9CHLO